MITIYGKNKCGWCIRAKQLAETLAVPFQYLNTTENPDYLDEVKRRVPDMKTFPQIFWDERYIGGYTEFATEVENTSGGYGDGKI